jgi:hypothetical protein
MRANQTFYPGPFCGGGYIPFDHRGVQVALALTTDEYRMIGLPFTSESNQPCVKSRSTRAGGVMKNYPESATRRAMKVTEVILKPLAREIKWIQAADILGVTPRHIRRMRMA